MADEVAPEIPQEPAMPGIETAPPETPVIHEPPVQAPEPTETPVIAPSPVTTPAPESRSRVFLKLAAERIQFRKRAKLDKILAYARTKKSITNDQAQALLRVSDSTAQRYLMQLVREGKLKRLGSTIDTTYEPA